MTEIPVVDLGRGVAMPMGGFGTWKMQGQQAYQAIRHALQVGYRHIDTATIYRNEDEVGRAMAASGLDGSDVFVTTKLPPGSAGRARAVIAESLRALRADYVDLWLVHWPPRRQVSPRLWREFLAVRDEGLCRAGGVKNYSGAERDAHSGARGASGRQPDRVEPAPIRSGPAGRTRRTRRRG